jgi:hypothetical protein
MSITYSVALAVKKEDAQKIINRKYIKQTNYELSIDQITQIINFFKEGEKEAPICINNDYVYFYWKYTKWWKLKLEIDYFYKLLKEQFNNHYDFVRISTNGEIVERRISIGILDTELKIKFNKGV